MYDWGIENGILWLPSGPVSAHIYLMGTRIAAISPVARPARRVYDASGCDVLPGAIDAHVHSRDPGYPDKEDIQHSTAAAAMGGVTTIVEMPNSRPAIHDIRAFRDRQAYFQGRALVDFALWSLWTPTMSEYQTSELIDVGTVGFKIFWGYALDAETWSLVYDTTQYDRPVVDPPTVGQVLEFLERISPTGRTVAVHAEEATIIRNRQQRGTARNRNDYQQLLWERPAVAEDSLIATLIQLARTSGAAVHIVHLASANMLGQLRQARAEGVNVSVETAPHYLYWNAQTIAEYEGWGKVFPPIRDPEHQRRLIDGVATGSIDLVASDHAPHHPREKGQGLAEAPAGLAGVQVLLLTLLDLAWRGLVPFERIPMVTSMVPAKRLRLWPQKGALAEGFDADVVIVDRHGTTQLDQEVLKTKHPQKPWLGQSLHGAIRTVFLRGVPIVQEGQLCEPDHPRGQFVTPR